MRHDQEMGLYPPLVNLPGGWELILVSLVMLALLVWVIWRVGPRR